MRLRPHARHALSLTFAIYLLEAGLSACAALPAGVELGRRLGARVWDASREAVLIEQLPELALLVRASVHEGLLAFGLLALLGPWLQMGWLVALSERAGPVRALGAGWSLTPRAWLVSLLMAIAGALLALPSLLTAYGVHRWLGAAPDARMHDLALAAALAPLLPLAMYAHTAHDLARAGALDGRALPSVRASLRLALRPSLWTRALGALLLGHALVLAAFGLAAQLGSGALAQAVTVALLQAALLMRLVARSAWLAEALACVAATHAPLAAHASEDGT